MIHFSDSHIHLFRNGFHGNLEENQELERYEQLRHIYGIGPALVVGYEGQERFVGNNDYLSELSETRDWLFPLRYVGKNTPQPSQWVGGFRGYAIYLDDWPFGTETARAMTDRAKQGSGVSPLVSVNGSMEMIAAAHSSLIGFAGATVLISHLGLPGKRVESITHASEILTPVFRLSESLDISVKISGLYAFDDSDDGRFAAPYMAALVETLGPDRLVWGSDYAPALDHQSVDKTFRLAPLISELLSPEEQVQVKSTNLSALLSV